MSKHFQETDLALPASGRRLVWGAFLAGLAMVLGSTGQLAPAGATPPTNVVDFGDQGTDKALRY